MKMKLIVIFLLFTVNFTAACRIFKNSAFRTIGVAVQEVNQMVEGYAVTVYSQLEVKDKESDLIIYDTDQELIPVNGHFLVDRQSGDDLNRQADIHISRGDYRTNSIVCVKTNATVPQSIVFTRLWWKTMRFVVLETVDSTNYVYDPFKNRIISMNHTRLPYIVKTFQKIWRNLRKLKVRVSAFQESLSFYGRKAGLGLGLDSSFLYEFAKYHNFTPVIVDGRNYKFSNLQVLRHQVEFGINSRYLMMYDHRYTLSSTIYGDDICNVFRRNKYVRGWDVFRTLLHGNVWLCLIAAVMVIHVLLVFICPNRSWSTWLGITSRSLISISVKPIIRETKERLIVGSCYLFSLIFTAYVQAMLYHILTGSPPTEIPSEDLVYKYVFVMRDTPFAGSFTAMRKKEYMLSVRSGLIDPEEYTIMCPGYTRNMAYIMNYGSVFEPMINNFVHSSFEAGLPDAWYSKTMMRRKHRMVVKESIKVLTLLDFEVAFFELLFGLSVSTLVFAGEVAFGKFQYFQKLLGEFEFIQSGFNYVERPNTV